MSRPEVVEFVEAHRNWRELHTCCEVNCKYTDVRCCGGGMTQAANASWWLDGVVSAYLMAERSRHNMYLVCFTRS